MKRFVIGLVALSLMLAPAQALAQSSTCQAYNPQSCNAVTGVTGTPSSATGEASSTGTLPFTGLDTGVLALAGGVLIVAGLIARLGVRRIN